MNTKWSQNITIALLLFIIASASILFLGDTFPFKMSLLAIGLYVLDILILWILSNIIKTRYATISSALSISSLLAILGSLTSFFNGGFLKVILSIVALFLSFILIKDVYEISWGRAILVDIVKFLIEITILLVLSSIFF